MRDLLPSPRFALLALLVVSACDAPSLDDTTWSCKSDADCGAGYACDLRMGGCVAIGGGGALPGGACVEHSDCEAGAFCDDGSCADLGPTSDEPGVSPEKIAIGLTGPVQSGAREEGAAFAAGVRAAFAAVNQAGGLSNRRLELVTLDDGGDETKAAENVASFLESNGDNESFAILAAGSQVASTVRNAAVEADRLFFGARAGTPDVYESFNQLVFATRPSLKDETRNAVRLFVSSAELRVPLENFAVLAEARGTSDEDALTAYGEIVHDALVDEIARRVLPPSAPPVPPVLRYAQNSQDMDTAIEAALQWMASGGIEANEVGARPVVLVLGATARPAAAFVEAMLDVFHQIKLGTNTGAAYGLNDVDVTRLQGIQDLTFWAPAEVGIDTMSDELVALGSYRTVSGQVPYCSRVVSTQVVPEVSATSSAADYVEALTSVDQNAVPTRAGFEGYVAARTLIAGLERVSPFVDTAALVSALEDMPGQDFGSGTIDFTASSHVGAEDVFGVSFDDACAETSVDLDLPDQPPPVSECPGGVCELQGVLFGENGTNTKRLRSTFEYLLKGTVFVGDDVNETILEIEPGTVIKGDFETTGTLVIRRGSKIMAEGTREAPIVFTSEKPQGERATGDWGGLVINGRAPYNCNPGVLIADEFTTDAAGYCQGIGEGGTGLFAGTDENDSSGVLRYVRVEYAGKLISDLSTGAENELNGIAFQGVGRGTVVDHIHVHRGQDDGVEFYGGTVDAKHVLITCADDDSLDWVGGWRGRVQYLVIQQCPGHGDNGFESDNRSGGNDNTPRSRPVIANATVIGLNNDEPRSAFGALLRQGTAATLANSLFLGFNNACLDIDHSATFAQAGALDAFDNFVPSGNLELHGTTLSCAEAFEEEESDPFTVQEVFESGSGNEVVPVGTQLLVNPFQSVDAAGTVSRFLPSPGSRLGSGVETFTDVYEATEGAFFDTVTFRGGVDPADDWTVGWTAFPEN